MAGYGVSKVDTHPHREEIVKEILEGISHASIARKHGISTSAVRNYYRRNLTRAAVQAKHELKDAKSIVDLANFTLQHLSSLVEAMSDRFKDPDDPTKFTMDPFAREIDVVYIDTIGDPNGEEKPVKVKRRATLQQLVDMIRQNVVQAYDFNLTIKRDDDRRIFTQALHEMNETSGNLVKIITMLAEAKVDVTKSHVFMFFLSALKRALAPFPGALEAVVAEFEREGREQPIH